MAIFVDDDVCVQNRMEKFNMHARAQTHIRVRITWRWAWIAQLMWAQQWIWWFLLTVARNIFALYLNPKNFVTIIYSAHSILARKESICRSFFSPHFLANRSNRFAFNARTLIEEECDVATKWKCTWKKLSWKMQRIDRNCSFRRMWPIGDVCVCVRVCLGYLWRIAVQSILMCFLYNTNRHTRNIRPQWTFNAHTVNLSAREGASEKKERTFCESLHQRCWLHIWPTI